ncbi:Eco57I restriction-modification methylase domain-containing protein [Aquiflexum sp. TKW24L]|uniref:Eco57I restriction-modification methylase domain-containing protein n=1 Tax=Aquiflexum sp. TKW24L TaxID=2942212 RepID=UPI0020BE4AB4|nr:Eco57I restriction-modification methylase domain-containing protein [Aquiflexum sp. TKW24L]MCL6259464.1 Eco57I restriction-modification methylase domain-containing protein [Aquiflexum sp. TKW24L]
MKEKDLKYKIQQKFDFAIWKEILPLLFKKIDYFSHAKNLFTENGKVIDGKQIGTVKLDDGKQLAIFTVEVADSVSIVRNRQGLREIAAKHIDQNIIHGALAFFYSKNQADYRFSFIAKEASLDMETGELIKGETKPKRYTYLLGANEACTTASKRMLLLAEKNLVDIRQLKEVFSVEALNKDFFKSYKIHYEKFWKHLADEGNQYRLALIDAEKDDKIKKEKPIRDFVKKLLGRIVFLHFLQKKGWMGCNAHTTDWTDGEPRFMQQLLEDYSKPEKFHSTCLTHLFFQTLNTKRPNDIFQIEGLKGKLNGSRVPYLNGGLFEPEKNKVTLEIDFPVDFFKELLEFFDQYNFTIDENSPDDHEVGIDPEMLGHIFENLLEDNRDKGAFYTPKEIVQYMCKESLIQYLLNYDSNEFRITNEDWKEAIEKFVRFHAVNEVLANKEIAVIVNQKLDDIKVCDPAIGSGAFPIGMLQEIFEAKRFIYPFLKTNQEFKPAEVKKNIIQNSIYGVDLEKGAVDIAQLRFWLSLVVEELNPHPLPNLDYKIMQGNSLLESFEGIPLNNLMNTKNVVYTVDSNPQMGLFGDNKGLQVRFDVIENELDNLSSYIKNYFTLEKKESKAEVKKKINRIVHDHLHFNIDLRKAKFEIILGEKEAIFGSIRFDIKDTIAKRNQKEKQIQKHQVEIDKLSIEIKSLEKALNELENIQETEERPYFLWHLYFKDVFDRGGFDVMIGNPPYINVENLDSSTKLHLFEFYKTCKGRTDIYIAFIESTLGLLRKKGVLSFIIPYPYINQNYGADSRKMLIENFFIKEIVDTSEYNVFETAIVKNIILNVIKKNANENTLIKKVLSKQNFVEGKFESSSINQYSFLELKEYRLETNQISEDLKIKPIMWENAFRLDDICLVAYGARLNHKTENIPKSHYIHNEYSEGYKPFLEGKNIERYYYDQAGWLDYRKDVHYNSMFPELFENEKLMFINVVSHKLRFAFDKKGMFNSHTIINCLKWDLLVGVLHPTVRKNLTIEKIKVASTFSYKFLLIVLNSSIINWYFKCFLSESLHFYPNDAKSLPIAKLAFENQKPFEIIAEYLIYVNDPKHEGLMEKVNNETVNEVFENVVNMMVYELYFEEEMKSKEIDVMKFVTSFTFPDIIKSEDPKAVIQKVYYELQQKDNPIRKRILIANSRSETIARINAANG